jgi:hypothetical protein
MSMPIPRIFNQHGPSQSVFAATSENFSIHGIVMMVGPLAVNNPG